MKALCVRDTPPARRQNRRSQTRDIRRLPDEENG